MHEPSRTSHKLLGSFGDVPDRACEVVERERATWRLDRGRRARDVHSGGSEDDTAGLVNLGFEGVDHDVALENNILAEAAALEDVRLRLAFHILGI